jgi:hypothetical protein
MFTAAKEKDAARSEGLKVEVEEGEGETLNVIC